MKLTMREAEAAVTVSFPKCDRCPPLTMWPAKNLIFNSCPKCKHPTDPVEAACVLKEKRVVHLPVVEEGKL